MIIHCELNDEETNLLMEILRNTNYNEGREADVFTSLYRNLMRYNE